MRLQKKLTTIFILLAILPVLIIGYLAYDIGRRAIEDQTINHLISSNILKSSELDRWIDGNKNSIEELAQRPLVQLYAEFITSHSATEQTYIETQRFLVENHLGPRLKYGGFFELFLMSPVDGIVMASTDEKEVGKQRDDRDYFLEGKKGTYVDGVYFSIPLEQPAMTVGTPVVDDNGNVVAVLAGRLDLSELSMIIVQQSGLSQTEDTYLVNASNFFVTEPRFGDGFALKRAVRTEGVNAGLSGENGIGFYDDYRAVPVIGAYNWLPGYNMCIITEIDQSEAFAPITRMGWITAVIVAILAALVVLLALVIARSLTRPMYQLAKGAQIVGSGNLDYNMDIKSDDEIGDLSREFNEMIRKLKLITVSRDELARSEERYRSTLENMLEGYQIISFDLRYLYLNDVAAAHSRKAREELLGHTMMEIFPGIEKTEMFTRLQHCMQDRVPQRMENEFAFADGSKGWYELSLQPMAEGVSILSWDITDRKQAELALKDLSSRQQALLSTIPEIVIQTDANKVYTWTNEAGLDFFGKDVIGREANYYFAGEQDTYNTVQPLFDGDENTIYVESWQRRRDGEKRLLAWWCRVLKDKENNVTGALSTARDITEIKKAEDALQQERNKFAKIVETAPGAICVFCWKHDGSAYFPYASSVMEDIYGFSPEELARDRSILQNRIHPQDLEDVHKELMESAHTLSPWYSEFRYQHPKKGEVWIESRFTPTRESDGSTVWYGTILDITGRKQVEAEIRKLNTELEQRVQERTAQLEATNKELETFSYSVSHDLRAPLRAIDGYTRILLEDYESRLDDEGRRICSVIRDNTHNMGSLIDDLLAFSRLGRAEMQCSRIDMATMAKSIFFELTSAEERKRIAFRIDSLPPAYGDPSLIRQVWTNLLSNAIKFTSKTKKPVISVQGKHNRTVDTYIVEDNGAGFDMKYVNKLFGVFQRLHSTSEFEGNGVGLAIVQRVVHRHGGRVRAEGEIDKGAKFHFTLPVKGG